MAREHVPASLTLNRGALILRCDYDADLVAAIKQLPATDRSWDKPNCAWAVDPKHGAYLAKIVAQYLGEIVLALQTAAAPKPEQRIIEVRYIGLTKDRGDSNRSAFGWSNGAWSVIFPEQVLKLWFEGIVSTEQKATTPTTLYGLLGIPQTVSDSEIKTAFRRMAKQWHPDYCREPNATEMFIEIKRAADLLSNPNKRARYDAGLILEATISKNNDYWAASLSTKWPTANGYRTPLRCGLILADGTQIVGRFVVSKIHQWLDITRNGKTLVTSWQAGQDHFTEVFV